MMKNKNLKAIIIAIFLLSAFNLARGQQKIADKEIFDQAKMAIYEKDWSKALRALSKLIQDFPQSSYLDASLYWQAYSLNKLSEEAAELDKEIALKKEAIEGINRLLGRFSSSSWRDDAKLLRLEIAEKLVSYGLSDFKKYIEGMIAGVEEGVISGVEGIKGGVEGGVIGGVEGALTGMEIEEEDPELEMKLIALNALLYVEKEKAWPILEKVARESQKARLRSQAVFILSQQADAKVIPLLEEVAVKDQDQRVRANAIFWLGQRHEEEATKALLRIYDQEKDWEVKDKIIFSLSQKSLSQQSRTVVTEKLIEIARTDPDIRARERAIFWLSQRKDQACQEALFKLYDDTKDQKTKEALIFAFSQFNSKAAIRKLIEIARKEENLSLRKKAIFWLGQSRDEEALKFFEEVLLKKME